MIGALGLTKLIEQKYFPYLLGGLVFIILGIFIYISSRVKRFFSKIPLIGDFFRSEKELNERDKEKIGDINIRNKNLRYDDAVYKAKADNIENALSGYSKSEDIQEAINQLSNLTLDEIKKVFEVFGIRTSYNYEGNLVEWFKSEDLTTSQQNELRNIFSEFNIW